MPTIKDQNNNNFAISNELVNNFREYIPDKIQVAMDLATEQKIKFLAVVTKDYQSMTIDGSELPDSLRELDIFVYSITHDKWRVSNSILAEKNSG